MAIKAQIPGPTLVVTLGSVSYLEFSHDSVQNPNMPRPSLDDADSLAGSEAGSHTDGLSLADATETASLARSDAVSMAASTRSVAARNAGSETARRPDMPISVFVDQTTDVRAPRPPLPWHPSHRTHDSSLWVVRRVALAPRTQPFPQPTEQPGHALLIDRITARTGLLARRHRAQ